MTDASDPARLLPFPGRCVGCRDRLNPGERSFCPICDEYWNGTMTMTDPSEAGRALAALRPRTTIRCEVCGAAFETWVRKTQQARTCSPACRQKLYRRQKR